MRDLFAHAVQRPAATGLVSIRRAAALRRLPARRSRRAALAMVLAGAAATPALAQTYTETILGSFNNTDGYEPEDYGGMVLLNGTLYGETFGGGANGDGVIFSEPVTGGTPTAIYSFTGAGDGEAAEAGLTLSADGSTFYGTTVDILSSTNYGTVFSIPVSGGTPTVLYDFSRSTESTYGFYPSESNPIQVGNTLYGAQEFGGAANDGLIFSIPTSGGTPTVLYSFTATARPSGLAISGSTLYGETTNGGANNDGYVFSMPLSGGTPTVLFSFNGTTGNLGAHPYGPPTLSPDGSTLYGMTYQGGTNNFGTVFSEPTSGGAPTTLVSFTGTSGNAPGDLGGFGQLLLIGNTLYGQTIDGGANNKGEIFSVPTTGGTPTVLHSFSSGADSSSYSALITDHLVTWNTSSGTWDNATSNWNGNLYGNSVTGGTNSKGDVFEITCPMEYVDPDQATFGSTITANSTVTIQSTDVAPAGVTVNNTTGFTYTFTGGAITGTGTLAVAAGTVVLSNTNTYTGGTAVNGGTLVVGAQNAIPANTALAIASGATVATNAASPNFGNIASPDITLSSLSVAGTLNLNQSPMVVNYTTVSPLASIVSGITAGNITSSIVQSSPTIYGIGTKDTGSSVQLMPTLLGDTTLSGSVGLQDYATVVKNFNLSGMTWTQGSFDYSGTVGLADYADVVRNFNQSIGASPSLAPSFKTLAVSPGLAAAVQPALNSLNTSVELVVNPTTGDVHLLDTVGGSVLSGYDITSASSSLVPFPKSHGSVAGNSLTYNDPNPNGTYAVIQNLTSGIAEGAASGTGGYDTNPLSPTASWGTLVTYVGPGYQYDLGDIFKGLGGGGAEDLQFTWLDAGSADTYTGEVEYTPEPTSVGALGIGAAGLLIRRRRKCVLSTKRH